MYTSSVPQVKYDIFLETLDHLYFFFIQTLHVLSLNPKILGKTHS